MTVKEMTDYKFVPVHGGGVCLVGSVSGKVVQTTNVKVVHYTTDCVETESGSLYKLSDPQPGTWLSELRTSRPDEYRRLEYFWLFSENKTKVDVLESFERMIKEHDYYFDYSDDGNVWRKGRDEREAIEKYTKEHPECKAIWDAFVKSH
jgi:hypothetical protein